MVTAHHASSSGHVLSSPAWLDSHFESCRAEYTAMLDCAGLAAGMSVLDAGCGAGSFLPLIRERVGMQATLLAFDIAAESLPAAAAAEPVAGSVDGLPFAAASLDGAWCANTLQYFADEEALGVLRELARVVKPGGIVAVKDVDMTAFKIWPAPPLLGAHLAEAAITGSNATPQSFGSLRGRELRRWMERAGLEDVRQHSFLIERWAPLTDIEAGFWADWLVYLASVAEARSVPPEDRETWSLLSTPAKARAFVERPDFYGCELQVVCVGQVPGRA